MRAGLQTKTRELICHKMFLCFDQIKGKRIILKSKNFKLPGNTTVTFFPFDTIFEHSEFTPNSRDTFISSETIYVYASYRLISWLFKRWLIDGNYCSQPHSHF